MRCRRRRWMRYSTSSPLSASTADWHLCRCGWSNTSCVGATSPSRCSAERTRSYTPMGILAPMSEGRLQHLPVSLFASVMGLGGTALAWRRAAMVWDVPQLPFYLFLVAALATFVLVATAELRHPVRMTFAPTITIALLVLATALAEEAPAVASVLWWVGAAGHLTAMVAVVTTWSQRPDIGAAAITPAWFIPVVGNVVVPLAARKVGAEDVGWFFFGVGIIMWLSILPLVMERILTHENPFPPKLMPTMAVFVAPPAVSTVSWHSLTGTVLDPIGRILYAAAIAFLLLLAAQLPRLVKVPFGLPFWAYTFPLAAASVAATTMAGSRPALGYNVVAVVLLAVATGVVLLVAALTLRAAARGQILVPEG
ncbi:MAG: C4-dicarboxylate ABC transporter [Micrococcales bacterium]|nr:MAG: C4-dicarboxylate ABC transporter [Micrococcales bacterium]